MVKRFIRGRGRRGRKQRRVRSQLSKRKKINAMLNKHLHRRFAANESLTISTNAAGSGPGFATKELTFSLDKVTQYAELSAMYDQYKINFVEIYMSWSPQMLPIAHVGTDQKPEHRAGIIPPCLKIYHIADYDDADPLTLNQFKERAKTKLTILKPQQRKKIVVKPAVLSQIYETLTSTGYAPKWNVKLDTNDANVPHYAYKFGIVRPEDATEAQNVILGAVDFEIRYNLTMVNTK